MDLGDDAAQVPDVYRTSAKSARTPACLHTRTLGRAGRAVVSLCAASLSKVCFKNVQE